MIPGFSGSSRQHDGVQIPSNSAARPTREWTVLVWSASDNDMHAYQVGDLDDMEQVGTSKDLAIVAQVDHKPLGGPVERLEIQKDEQSGLHSKVLETVPNCTMDSGQKLAEFVQWGMEKYPAKHTWLVISGHGDAWHGACETGEEARYMDLSTMKSALQTASKNLGRGLDLISFDACYMGSAEAAYQLRDQAHYMVASQEEVGYYGQPYSKVLAVDFSQMSPLALAHHLVNMGSQDSNEFKTIAAYDLSQMSQVANATKELGEKIAVSRADLSQTAQETQDFYGYRDLHHFAQKVAELDPSARDAAQMVQGAIEKAVVAEKHAKSHPNSHGLQIETRQAVPADYDWSASEWSEAYQTTDFAQDTNWAKNTWQKLQPSPDHS